MGEERTNINLLKFPSRYYYIIFIMKRNLNTKLNQCINGAYYKPKKSYASFQTKGFEKASNLEKIL